MAKIIFGLNNDMRLPKPDLDSVKSDVNLKALLGYGDNVDFYVNGVKTTDNVTLSDSDEVSIQTRQSNKA